MMLRPLKTALLAAAFILQSACSTAPISATSSGATRNFHVPSGKSSIFVYREGLAGALFRYGVFLDNTMVADISANMYVELQVEPGAHYVGIKPPATIGPITVLLVAESGRAYYLTHSWFSGSFSQVDQKTAQSLINGLTPFEK